MAKQLNVDLRFTANTSQAKQAINELNSAINKLAYGKMPQNSGLSPEKFQQAATSARELAYHLNRAFNLKTGNLDLSKLDASLKSSQTSLTQLTSNFANAGKAGQDAFVALAKSIAAADQPVLSINNTLSQLWVTLKNTARFQLSSSIIHGFVGSVETAFHYAQDLNQSLNNIRIVTGQNADQMARFAEQANKTAKALNTTTLDYTNASLIYYQQGLSDQEVQERTNVTVKMANVSRQSAEDVSQQLTAVWNNFAKGGENLEYYADVMTALGAATASSSEEIATGLERFAAIADTVGLSYENASAALATITATTRQSAETVGTGLRTLFSRLQSLSLGETLEDGVDLTKYTQALEKVGVSALDSSGKLRDMDDVLEDLADRWQTLGRAEQNALAQTVGGVRQYTTLIALMDNWDFMEQNQQVAANAQGTLQEQADIYAESWEAARDRVQASMESLYQQILNDKFFIGFNNGIADAVSGISDFIEALGGIKPVIIGLGGILLSAFANKIGPTFTSLVNNIKILTGGAKEVYTRMNTDFQSASQQAMNQGNWSNSTKAQVTGAQQITLAKSKLALMNDKLSASERMQAEIQISGYEALAQQLVEQAQKIEQLQAAEEKLQATRELALQKAQQTEAAASRARSDALLGVKNTLNKTLEINPNGSTEATRNLINQQLNRQYGRTASFTDRLASNFLGNNPTNFALGKTIGNLAVKNFNFSSGNIGDIKTQFADLQKGLNPLIQTLDKDVSTRINNIFKSIQGVSKNAGAEGLKELETQANTLASALTKAEIPAQNLGKALIALGADKDAVNKYLEASEALTKAKENLAKVEKENEDARKAAQAEVDAAQAKYDETEQQMKDSTDKFTPTHKITGSEAFSSIIGGATSAVMAVQSLSTALQTLNNPDISGLEKITSVLMGISMAATSGISAVSSFTKVYNAVKDKGGFGAVLKSISPAAVAATAAVVALGVALYALYQEYNRDAIAAQKATEAAENLHSTASETKQDFEDLKSTFATYDSLVEALNECTRGTTEWHEALQAVNQEMLNILSNNPKLASQMNIQYDENGLLQVTNRDELLKQSEEIATRAQNASIVSDIFASQAQLQSSKTNLVRRYQGINNTEAGISFDEQNAAIATAVQDENLGQYATMTVQQVMDSFASSWKMGEASLKDFATSLIELSKNSEEVSKQIENSASLIAESELGEAFNAAEKKIASLSMDTAVETIKQEVMEQGKNGINKFSNASDPEVMALWERYSKATGTNYSLATSNAVTGTDNNRAFRYLDNGETKTVPLEEMAAAIAASEALDGLADSASKAREALNVLPEENKQIVEGYLAGNGFDNITQEQYNDIIKNKTEENTDTWFSDFLTEDLVAQLGEDYVATMQSSFESIDFNTIADNLIWSARNAFKELQEKDIFADLTLGQQKSIGETLQQIYSETGKKGLDLVKEWFNTDDIDVEQLSEIFSSIDWKTTSAEDLAEKLAEVGIEVEATDGPLTDFINKMKEIAGISIDEATEWYNKNQEFQEKSENGEAFTAEDVAKFAEMYGEDITNQVFSRNLNGESFIADQQLFNQTINPNALYERIVANEEANQQVMQELAGKFDLGQLQKNYAGSQETGEVYLQGSGYNNQYAVQGQLDLLNAAGITSFGEYADVTMDAETLTAISEAVSGLTANWQNFGDGQQYVGNQVEQVKTALITTASTVGELQDNMFKYQGTQDDLNKGYINLARQTEEGRKALNKYIEALKEAEKNGEDTTEITRDFQKTIKDIQADKAAKNIKEISDNLEDLSDNDADDIAKELESVFGDRITGEWVQNNKELVNQWLNGTDEERQAAADVMEMQTDLQAAIQQTSTLLEGSNGTSTDFKLNIDDSAINITESKVEALKAALANPAILTVDGKANLGALLAELQAADWSAQEVASYLAMLGQSGVHFEGNAEAIPSPPNGENMQAWTDWYKDLIEVVGDIEIDVKSGQVPGGVPTHMKSVGGGGGGGGKQRKLKKAEDETERYHVIKEVLDDLNREYDNITESKDRAFGQAHLKAMDQEIEHLKKLQKATQQYADEAKAYIQTDWEKLSSYGFNIQRDEQGLIINYDELIKQAVDQANSMAEEEADEWFSQFKKDLDNYIDSRNIWEEQQDAANDFTFKIDDLEVEKIQYNVQLLIDVNTDNLDYLDWILQRIEEDVFNVGDAIDNITEQASSIVNTLYDSDMGIFRGMSDLLTHAGFSEGEASSLLSGGGLSRDQLESVELTEKEVEALKDLRDQAMDYAQKLWEMRKTVFEELTDAWDAWNEKIEYNLDLFEHYQSFLDVFADIIDLIGLSQLNMDRIARTQLTRSNFEVQISQLDAQKKVMKEYRKQEQEYMAHLNEARARGNEYDIQLWESYLNEVQTNAREAEENMMDDWEATLETAGDLFDQMVDDAIATFEKEMSGMFRSFNELQQAFDQQTEISDRFVEDYQKIYDLSKLNRDIQNSIDDNDSIKAKERLRDLQEEINKLQESNTKMSQYDLDYLRKKYELRLAEIQLEDAQNAKSTVRMSRDSENNWSYVYTADEDAMEEAYQNYEDKLYEMQQLNTEYIKEMQNNILQSQIELSEAIRQLDRSTYGSDEEYEAAVERLRSYYLGQYDYYSEEMQKALGNNKTTYDQDWTWYSELTGYKKSADEDYLDKFEETIYSQLTGYRDLEDAQDAYKDATKSMVEALKQAYSEWATNVETAMKTVGTSTEGFADTVYNSSEEIVDAAAQADAATQEMAANMTAALTDNMNAVTEWQRTWSDYIESIIDGIQRAIQAINELLMVQATMKKTEPTPEPETPPAVQQEEQKQEPSVKVGDRVTVKQSASNFTRNGGNGTYMQRWVPGSTFDVLDVDGDQVEIGLGGVVTGWVRKKDLVGFDTGGYTGAWDNSGKLAFLHQKELVLNDQDTQNLLNAVDLVREIVRVVDLNASTAALSLTPLNPLVPQPETQEFQQDVTIHAEFPNAVNHDEIYQAFESLTNMASQFASRKNK